MPIDFFLFRESLASCAIEGNKTAKLCLEALRKVATKERLTKEEREALAAMVEAWDKKE